MLPTNLWLVGVHFHSSFDTGKWKIDQHGLCNRSETDRSQVKELSQLHNILFEALARYRRGEEKLVGPFTCVVFRQLERIVNISHHRQIPDILGTIRLIQRNVSGVQPQGQKTLVTLLCEQLHALAAQVLQPTDPRIQLFGVLKELPQDQKWDSQGHMLMAFDAYCRHLWFARLGSNDIKAYYSYNQASFPRAEPGQFYEKFEGKSMYQILTMLRKVDLDLGQYSVATFCLWHTAIHYLFHEKRYSDSETLCHELSKRILGPFKLHPECLQNCSVDFDTAESHCQDLAKNVLAWLEEEPDVNPQVLHHGQLGFDIVKTFHLLGRSQEELARCQKLSSQFGEERNMLEQALLNFDMALYLRLLTTQNGIWDPLLKSVLMALISVGTDLRLDHGVEVWQEQLQAIIMTVSENDRAQRDLENKIPASAGG
ncbi:hypothetical protein BKA65DRAFT_581844 [Rhexocercosporidium sp. MPI-PUGE-AT-0058]|nr:hypothetical protein BKA65DRAFT_581844 [Rhexocercosporidium sp. MPI-PUGE-AT-0058]